MLTTDYDLGSRDVSSCFSMPQETSPMEGLPGLSDQRRCPDSPPTLEDEGTEDGRLYPMPEETRAPVYNLI